MIEQIIDDNEKILWQGKPDFLLYVVGKPFIYLFAIIWAVLDGLLIPKFFEGAEFFGSPFLILFFVLHLFPVWLAILLPIYRVFNYRNIEYAVTDKRGYVSTDQAFPNAYRPKENTGYEMEYKEK